MTPYLVSALDGVAVGLLYFTLAAGLAIIFGAADILNLAHGTLYLGGAYLAWRLADGTWPRLILLTAAAAVCGAAAGLLLAGLTRPLARRGHLDQALLTLGLALIGADLISIATGGQPVPAPVPHGLDDSITLAGLTYPLYRLALIGAGLAIAMGLWIVLHRTLAGAIVRAVVADPHMAQATGIHTRRVLALVFAAGAGLAVLGGALGAPILPAGPGTDEHVLVMSLIVIVIGGAGSIPATLTGALLVGQIDTLGRALAPRTAAFALYALLLIALVARPNGLARRTAEP
jgi:branched-chain amino acid transport system permease protein